MKAKPQTVSPITIAVQAVVSQSSERFPKVQNLQKNVSTTIWPSALEICYMT
jgi:hypothetical protein